MSQGRLPQDPDLIVWTPRVQVTLAWEPRGPRAGRRSARETGGVRSPAPRRRLAGRFELLGLQHKTRLHLVLRMHPSQSPAQRGEEEPPSARRPLPAPLSGSPLRGWRPRSPKAPCRHLRLCLLQGSSSGRVAGQSAARPSCHNGRPVPPNSLGTSLETWPSTGRRRQATDDVAQWRVSAPA